jgi:hypothetical protein
VPLLSIAPSWLSGNNFSAIAVPTSTFIRHNYATDGCTLCPARMA